MDLKTHIEKHIAAIKLTDITLHKKGPYGLVLDYEHIDVLNALCSRYFDASQETIPKHIHQVWIGPNKPPWEWINTFKEAFIMAHPDWEYTLWREEDIATLKLENQKAYDTETQFSGKVNILRYELLYKFGGLYIDADIEWINKKPFEVLLNSVNKTLVFAGKEDDVLMANSVIGSSKGNPILSLMVKLLGETFSTTRVDWNMRTWQSTGPQFFSEVSRNFGITAFPTHYFYPVSWLKNHIGIDTTQFESSFMIQYGYSTNQLGIIKEGGH